MQAYYSDPEYSEYSKPMSPSRCACLLTSLFGGEEHLMLEMTSQQDSMSELLETSSEIQALWGDFASTSEAIVAYVDRRTKML